MEDYSDTIELIDNIIGYDVSNIFTYKNSIIKMLLIFNKLNKLIKCIIKYDENNIIIEHNDYYEIKCRESDLFKFLAVKCFAPDYYIALLNISSNNI
ncbi:unknown similar to AMEV123 [Mythimna separata entomopoxvirus 'L']|uniref:Uncharacterized protein n=1 Tax=Mythimna separata entomopoxvirus 'L' TaxID=1293572 RepID=A0A916P1C2_9POXV|nr:unknown similar to AMEV123 [Mythimna separata entomopoxvirus 'L']CCU56247.1 unknown similar to AMEV123 [Mythimna separata entomopoxvirus 'L']